jgi:hypothetical protein
MRKYKTRIYDNWKFELEFQLDSNGKYKAHALISSKVSRFDWAKLYIGHFGSVDELKKGFESFKYDFLESYERVGKEMIARGVLYHV